MLPQIDRQLLHQSIDQRRSIQIQEIDDRQRAFLRMALRERLGLRADELTA
jgi:hypothetical protein